jgi:hypothetical protein
MAAYPQPGWKPQPAALTCLVTMGLAARAWLRAGVMSGIPVIAVLAQEAPGTTENSLRPSSSQKLGGDCLPRANQRKLQSVRGARWLCTPCRIFIVYTKVGTLQRYAQISQLWSCGARKVKDPIGA